MTDMKAFADPPVDNRWAKIWRLSEQLRGAGYEPDLDSDEPYLTLERTNRPPIRVRCGPRASDEGRLWFFSPPGTPLGEVGDPDVIVRIKGLMTAEA